MGASINIMVGGEAGQGIQSLGLILSKAFSRSGLHVFADQDYESRIRGGHNFFRIRASADEVRAITEDIDILVALNQETIDLHIAKLVNNGFVVSDSEKAKTPDIGGQFLSVPLTKLAEEKAGNKLMSNTVALGAALALISYDRDKMATIIREQFGSGETGEGNVRAAAAGYEYALTNFKGNTIQSPKAKRGQETLLLNGNEAIALGAIAAGCSFMAAYPMTPATTIMEYLASRMDDIGLVVVQPEDEIAAINMAIGAAFAGSRAMTATSGSGFALMVEGLGLSGITETPIVAILAQRPAPAVGLPTRTEQGDLQFVLTAAPGDFPRAVLAPATVEDAFWLTVKAFNLAEQYQLPVIVLTDHHLATSYFTTEPFDLSSVKVDRGLLLTNDNIGDPSQYKRHSITPSGISPRALPLETKATVVTDADEHDEAGHLIEDADTRTRMMAKRLRKLDLMKQEIDEPRLYGPQQAKNTIVGWGSTYGALKEATDMLHADGLDVNFLHITGLLPFPTKRVYEVLGKSATSIVVESNATGQLARLIRTETGIMVNKSILKFDGRPFTPREIATRIKEEVKQLW